MGRGQDAPWNAHQSPGSCSSVFFGTACFEDFFPLWLHSLCQCTNQEPIKDKCPGLPVAERPSTGAVRRAPCSQLSRPRPRCSPEPSCRQTFLIIYLSGWV